MDDKSKGSRVNRFMSGNIKGIGAVLVLASVALLAFALMSTRGDVAADDGLPSKPTGLSVSSTPGSLAVAVDWNDVEGAVDYLVRWRVSGPGQKLNDGIRSASSDAQISVAGYGKWLVRVEACDEAGCGKPATKHIHVKETPNPTPEPTPSPTPEPTLNPTPEPTPTSSLAVAISASPSGTVEPGDTVTLTANISGAPSGRPSYHWEIYLSDWYGVSQETTLSYLQNNAASEGFRVTVTYPSGESASSPRFVVTWAESAPKPTSEPTPEPTPEPTATATPEPTPKVVITANPNTPMAGESVTLSADVANAPTGVNVSYQWEVDTGSGWSEAGTDETLSYEGEPSQVVLFRAKVTFGDEPPVDSNPIYVFWTEVTMEIVGSSETPPESSQSNQADGEGTTPGDFGRISRFPRFDCRERRDKIELTEITLVDKGVRLEWNDPGRSDITGYQYQLQQSGSFSTGPGIGTWHHATVASMSSFPLDGLEYGRTYGLLLRAITQGSKTYCFTTLVFVTPHSPRVEALTGFTAEAMTASVSPMIRLTWNPPTTVGLIYDVQYKGHPSPVSWQTITDAEINFLGPILHTIISDVECGYHFSYDVRIRAARRVGGVREVGPYTPIVRGIRPGFRGTAEGNGISGLNVADCIFGLGGDDTITGMGGDDWLIGGDGNDTIYGGTSDAGSMGSGADTMYGNDGIDTMYGGDGNDWMAGGKGDDLIQGDHGDDTLDGGKGDDVLWGGLGNDYLDGGPDDDRLHGGLGDDTLRGGHGTNILYGDPGADKLYGVSGVDTALYGHALHTITESVTVDLGLGRGKGGDADGDTYAGIEHVIGTTFNDTITGNYMNNVLEGRRGNDVIRGDSGNDKVDGEEGNDTVHGDSGNDIVLGGGGSDSMYGGKGDDVLWGEGGTDLFHFSGKFGNDTIQDYTLGVSKSASEPIYLCRPTSTSGIPAYSGADDGTDYVITVRSPGSPKTEGTIRLVGITSSSTNFAKLNIVIPYSTGGGCP